MQKISITPGVFVLAGDKQLEIVATISSSKIQARDVVTGETVLLSPGEITCELKKNPIESDHDFVQTQQSRVSGEIKEEDFQLASHRFSVLSSFAGKRQLSKREMEQCILALGVSASQIRRLLGRMDMNVGSLSLLPQLRGRRRGVKLIDESAEELIQKTIDEYYKGPGVTIKSIITKVEERCCAISIPAPSPATIAGRIRQRRPRALLTKKTGSKEARQIYEVRGGKIQPEAPLELIQIDHALVDCIVVDSDQLLPLMRPWVTVAIDVFTRVILGFYLSLFYPSGMSVALCISNMMLPKERWLKSYGLNDIEYPFYGIPKRIHVDNAREFRSKNLADSCRQYGIELTFRPKGTPHNGAHIERLIGTLMGKIHFLPGTTMSSIKDKKNYKSEKYAALTFADFREWFIRQSEIYHKTLHSAIGCSPLHKWESHFRSENGNVYYPPIIEDQLRLLIDFMPLKKRVISRAGIRMHNIDYYSSTLRRFDIGTKCVVRYDPDFISKIWILPIGERNYIELGYADLRLPNTSLSEFKRLRVKLRNDSERRVPAKEVFNLIARNETLVSTAVAKNKQARKVRERKKSRASDPGHPLNQAPPAIDHAESLDWSVKPEPYDVED